MQTIDGIYRKALSSINISKSEPYIVADLVYKVVDATNKIKSRKLYKKIVSTSGIFIHSSPFVTYSGINSIGRKPSPKSVEIGDLLFLRTYKKLDGSIQRHALLLQAKKEHFIDFYPLVPDNPKQHHLYANWPQFEYTRSGVLNGQTRHISGPYLYHAAQYLVIDSRKKFGTYMPYSPKIRYYKNLVRQLTDFLYGHEGKTFIYGNKNNNWDHVITDLMDVTAKRVRKEMGGIRGHNVMYLNLHKQALANNFSSDEIDSFNASYGNNNEPPNFDNLEYEKEGDGISIIEFIIEEAEDN